MEKRKMMPFDKCPICGCELFEKKVGKILRGGNNTAIIQVKAEVCLHCGERLFTQEAVRQFEEIRKKLERQETEQYHQIGMTYQV